MLRILYVLPVGERGGLEVVLLQILKSLDRSAFGPGVAVLEDGPFIAELRETGTPTWVIESGRVRNVPRAAATIMRLTRLVTEEGIDVVHTMNAKAHLYGGSAAAVCGLPCVYHLHGVPRPSLTRDGVVSALSVALPAARTVACSQFVADGFHEAWHSRRAVRVVRNGLIAPTLTPSPGQLRAELRIPDGATLIVMVARLQRWKGVHVFIEAAAQVARLRSDVHFLVVGGALFGLEETYGLDLRSRVATLGLDGTVVFTGHRIDVDRFFAAADVIVHASIEPDPFPTVLLEAMAAGKPVVASDLGGPREIVIEGETGYLVPPDCADRLAESILSLIENPDLRLRMGRAGAARFGAHFGAGRMAGELQAMYLQLVTHSRSG